MIQTITCWFEIICCWKRWNCELAVWTELGSIVLTIITSELTGAVDWRAEPCVSSWSSALNREERKDGMFCLRAPVLPESLCWLLMLHYPIPSSPWSDRCSPFLSSPSSFTLPSLQPAEFCKRLSRGWTAIRMRRVSLFSPQTFPLVCGWLTCHSHSASKCEQTFPFLSRPPHANPVRICTQTRVSSVYCRCLVSGSHWWGLFFHHYFVWKKSKKVPPGDVSQKSAPLLQLSWRWL